MKARLIKDYRVAPEGHTTLFLSVGQIVDGIIAEFALADGAAESLEASDQGEEILSVEVKRRGRPPKYRGPEVVK